VPNGKVDRPRARELAEELAAVPACTG
jgi:hypothetical protein